MKRSLLLNLASVIVVLGAVSVLFAQSSTAEYKIVRSDQLKVLTTEKCKASWLVSVYAQPKVASKGLIEKASKEILGTYQSDEQVTIVFFISEEVARRFPSDTEDEEADLRFIRGITIFEPDNGKKLTWIFPNGLSPGDAFFKDLFDLGSK